VYKFGKIKSTRNNLITFKRITEVKPEESE